MEKNLLKQNKESWDAIADSFFGVTALPVYGCFIPTEDELGLFPVLENKKVLDIGCGSGHSLKWCGDKGAKELWGLTCQPSKLKMQRSFYPITIINHTFLMPLWSKTQVFQNIILISSTQYMP